MARASASNRFASVPRRDGPSAFQRQPDRPPVRWHVGTPHLEERHAEVRARRITAEAPARREQAAAVLPRPGVGLANDHVVDVGRYAGHEPGQIGPQPSRPIVTKLEPPGGACLPDLGIRRSPVRQAMTLDEPRPERDKACSRSIEGVGWASALSHLIDEFADPPRVVGDEAIADRLRLDVAQIAEPPVLESISSQRWRGEPQPFPSADEAGDDAPTAGGEPAAERHPASAREQPDDRKRRELDIEHDDVRRCELPVTSSASFADLCIALLAAVRNRDGETRRSPNGSKRPRSARRRSTTRRRGRSGTVAWSRIRSSQPSTRPQAANSFGLAGSLGHHDVA